MSRKLIRELEQRIVRQAVDDLLAKGYRLTVSLERGYDLDECLIGSADPEKIMAEAFAGDDCHIFVHEADRDDFVEDGQINSIGWVRCVYGNDGWDVISDYTTNLEDVLTSAHAISAQYA